MCTSIPLARFHSTLSRSTSFSRFAPSRIADNQFFTPNHGIAWKYSVHSMDCSSKFRCGCILRRDSDIASQLPDLTNLLQVLRNRRMNEGVSGKNARLGEVFLVGTGPGDPDLLTVKAARVIQSADVVLYDRLVSNDVLNMVGLGARLLYVGKSSGFHSRTQDEIHELLLNFAEVGATVVRLKGGDPLIFGRGGEEMEFLKQNGIQVNIIPGITAASGIAAELRIPLTQRGVAESVMFLTGHSRKGGVEVPNVAADPESTLIFYMGLATLPLFASKLIQGGLFPGTPAVAVERGTTPQQRMVFGELWEMGSKVGSAGLLSPTLIIIGKVVALSPLWPDAHLTLHPKQEENVHPSI